MSSSAAVPNGATPSPLCSKCEATLDTRGYPRWCKACQNTYRKEYNATRHEMQKIKGFAEGVEMFRTYLSENFAKYDPPLTLSSKRVAEIVAQAKLPA